MSFFNDNFTEHDRYYIVLALAKTCEALYDEMIGHMLYRVLKDWEQEVREVMEYEEENDERNKVD